MPDLLSKFSEIRPDSVPHIQKTQFVRLYIDLLFIVPFLLYLSMKKKPLSNVNKALLASIGLGVLYFNGQRYLITKDSLTKIKV
jgi:hypothetical protein